MTCRALVAGHHAGVVDVLAQLLVAAGIEVAATVAGDVELPEAASIGAVDVAVVTCAPGEATLTRIRARMPAVRIVAVTWHQADERTVPADVVVVPAGRIRADLPTAVRRSAGGDA